MTVNQEDGETSKQVTVTRCPANHLSSLPAPRLLPSKEVGAFLLVSVFIVSKGISSREKQGGLLFCV